MASKFLYQVVPTKLLPSIMERGFIPRAGINNDKGYSSRVWLFTDLNMAYFMAWWWFHDVMSEAEDRAKPDLVNLLRWVEGGDIGWQWDGKEWRAVSIDTLSIVQISRTKVPHCFPSDVPSALPPQFRRKRVWTPDFIAPPFTVHKLDGEFFLSNRFQKFMARIPSVRAAQQERPIVRENGKIDWLKGRQGRLPRHNVRRPR